MSQNNGMMDWIKMYPNLNMTNILDVDGGVGGLNCTIYLVTPIVLLEMFLIPKIHGISMVNLNPKSYFPTLISKGC
jgi:hypothetical protein